jgi:cytochrome c-type biogenesis protein CcmH/NrfG
LGGWGYGYGGYGGYGYGGYGGYGNWGYGYPGYGYGYGSGYGSGYGFGGYCYPSYGYGGASLGYGSGYGYSPYSTVVATTTPVVTAATTSAQVAAATPGSSNFADQGEAAFKSGDYQQAAYNFQHAVIDNPQNPVLILMHAQALFATGKFADAAGATEAALAQLPKDQWGVVVGNYKELYSRSDDYTTQLRALEAAVKSKPDDPATRFLLGYHYAYLGYPRQAVDQLNQVVTLAPSDEMAKQVRDEMQAKLPAPVNAAPSAPVVTPAVPVPPAPLSPIATPPSASA